MIVHSEDDQRAGDGEAAPVTLRLLGPIEMCERGQVLPLGPPQRQVVLAALAVAGLSRRAAA